MTSRLNFTLAIVMMLVAVSHVLALKKINAMQSARPAAHDLLAE
jgi:hypothetical protein